MLATAVGFHLGSQSVAAQSPSDIAGYSAVAGVHYVIQANGDMWINIDFTKPAMYRGNFWTGPGTLPFNEKFKPKD